MCQELEVLLWYQSELLYSLSKKMGARPPGATFSYIFLLFIRGINFRNQNDVEFDFSIGHALVLFQIL